MSEFQFFIQVYVKDLFFAEMMMMMIMVMDG